MKGIKCSFERGVDYNSRIDDLPGYYKSVVYFAIMSYSFLLKSEHHRNKEFSLQEFADIIRKTYSRNAKTNEVCRVLSLVSEFIESGLDQ